MAKDQIQIKPVVFNEFTQFIGLPWDGDDFTPEELTVRAETEKILRAVQKLRRSLDELQEEHRQLRIHVRRDVVSGLFQDYVTARLSHDFFGKERE